MNSRGITTNAAAAADLASARLQETNAVNNHVAWDESAALEQTVWEEDPERWDGLS